MSLPVLIVRLRYMHDVSFLIYAFAVAPRPARLCQSLSDSLPICVSLHEQVVTIGWKRPRTFLSRKMRFPLFSPFLFRYMSRPSKHEESIFFKKG